MMTTPSIALIVPVMNEYTNLKKLISYLPRLGCDEVVIVDGGSIDGSVALLESSSITYVLSPAGRAKQMNVGVNASKSDILLFIHADTIINEGDISAMCRALQATDVVGGRFDVRLSGHALAFRLIEWMINTRSRLSKISTGDQCQFVRREVFESMGGFAAMPLLEDVDFSIRLKKLGSIACLRDRVVTSSRRWEQHGVMKTVWLMWKIRLLYWFGVAPEKLAQLYRDAR